MTQLYAKVFTQILDSSLAEDYRTRHVFMDVLLLAENGILDMTREAIARRTNVPLEVINEALAKLEAPDPSSRDGTEDGRRLLPLDNHRDWGWIIVNWDKYEAIKTQQHRNNQARERKRRERERLREAMQHPPQTPYNTSTSTSTKGCVTERDTSVTSKTCHTGIVTKRDIPKSLIIPSLDEMNLYGDKIGLPPREVEKCRNYYEGNGWRTGKNPVKSWQGVMRNWKLHWEENGRPGISKSSGTIGQDVDRLLKELTHEADTSKM